MLTQPMAPIFFTVLSLLLIPVLLRRALVLLYTNNEDSFGVCENTVEYDYIETAIPLICLAIIKISASLH